VVVLKALLARDLEDHAQENRLRLAALDERLRVHQEAFRRWRLLVRKIRDEDLFDYAHECERWWEENCLYLGDHSREAFRDAVFAAPNYVSAFNSRRQLDDEGVKIMKLWWDELWEAGDVLLKDAGLPGFTERERAQSEFSASGEVEDDKT
jgi:hypothetical protein